LRRHQGVLPLTAFYWRVEMNVVIGIFILIGYLAIGIIFNGAMNEEWQEFSFILMLFWPLALAMLIFFGLISLLYTIGEKIKEKLL